MNHDENEVCDDEKCQQCCCHDDLENGFCIDCVKYVEVDRDYDNGDIF